MQILTTNMSIDARLRSLRIIARKNFKTIINHVIETCIVRKENKHKKSRPDICMFCSSTQDITREHVVPRWAFEGCTEKFFITNINGLHQTYNKTTIPACSVCNNERLNTLEVYVNTLFAEINLETTYFTDYEIENIIRWLEIVDYKFQILNARRVFLGSKEKGYIPYLADFPISVLMKDSPSKSVMEIRRSLKRLTIKNKHKNLKSLIVLATSNKNFHFFHSMDDFIFIELPQFEKAFFYFYKRTFSTANEAKKEAKKIVDKVYN